MAATSEQSNHFRADINALRALAVLSVIAFHFKLGAASGFIGVDVFFIISGFLIGGQVIHQLAEGEFRLKTFFLSRIRRIFPALAVVCLAVFLWGWFFQLPGDYKRISKDVAAAPIFISNIIFAHQSGYFDPAAELKPLLHTWSLSVEGQFYLLLPFVLLATFRLPSRFRVLPIWALGTASFVAALLMVKNSPDSAFFSFSARAWEFLIGNLLAWYVRKYQGQQRLGEKTRSAIIALLWASLIAACIFLPKSVPWPGFWTLVPTLLSAGIIGLGSFGGPVSVWLNNRVIQHVGNISYSLYLWHWPLLICWNLTSMEPAQSGGTAIWGILALTWVLAWTSWRFIEQPVRQNRTVWNQARLVRAYGGGALAFLLAAVVVSRTGGLPIRLPSYFDLEGVVKAEKTPDTKACWQLPGTQEERHIWGCDLGESHTQPTVVVWGDSHSLQLLEPLQLQFERTGTTGLLFHYPACEPSFSGHSSGGTGCDNHNAAVVRLLKKTPSVRTVLISIRQNETSRVNRAAEAAAVLLSRGYKVVFLGPLPEAPRPVAQEWAKRQFIEREALRQLEVARDARTRVASFDERLSVWRKVTADLQQRFPTRFTPVELTDSFCGMAKCWLVKDGVALLRDADHLTYDGANIVVLQVAAALELGHNGENLVQASLK